ncbi:probable disease resistance protein At1g61190 isoform X6 [Diospyros lotus]|uniref:probable disease resistance protein At1g61190 isoform X6 n=1 Tax=Diospyros lotus TaxID=55363 RepID=UPI00224D98B1|nr:probable disease resistance protein At1g61190 isoform X6 [Diospyros lotus]
MSSCVGTILSSLKEPVMKHGAYVFQYEDLVHRLEKENRRLGEKKERIQRLVDTATRNGRFIETEVSSWLGEVEQMERDIANFLRQQENREQMERDFANFLRQQENGEQMEQDFVNFLGQQENGEQIMERDFANFLREQENGEQMERDFANFLRQQENGESFKCFPGCMCPNLLWRHKRGKDADDKMSEVTKLISRGELLQTPPVARDAPFQSEPLFDSSQYYTTFPSRASVFEEIMEALKDSGVDMIGVHGPGGAGKTTMVKEVAKEARKLGIFFKIVIVVVSKDPNTSKLQEDIESQLELRYERTSESGRADELRKALLNGKKILVILDDLWQGLDLNAIGIPISGPSHKDCKILLTSRRKDVFKVMGVHSYFSVGYLEENEAWELFTKVTGDFGVDELIAREVSKKCGGLPIAIVAVAAALKDEEEVEWRNALLQLKNSPLKYIEEIDPVGYTPLKWSYDFLKDEDAKSCFLLCCLFPEDAQISIDDLVKYSFALGFLGRVDTLKDARIQVQAMVNKLKRSCLLLNGINEYYVSMHDVIRDLAISITEVKQTEHGVGRDWPGRQQFMVNHEIREWPKNDAWKQHTAISLRINNDNFPSRCGVLDCPLVHTLVLKLGKFSAIIPNDFFKGMEEARVLDLESISLELPSSILELHHLRMLRLSNCKLLGDLTTIQNLKNHIKILSFEGFEIEELPQEIGELICLRSLKLERPKVIPKDVISKLIHLEELYVLGTFIGWDTTVDGKGMSNASIAELKSLTQLTVLYVRISAESFKIMVQECPNLFQKLISFAILINLPPNSYMFRMQTLNVLEIHDIHRIDDEFHLLMDKVNVLWLKRIPHLEGLFLHGKPQLKFIASGGGPFSKLTALNICDCNGMKFLFTSSIARALQQLKTLEVSRCSKMEQIIGAVDDHHEERVAIDETIIFSRLVYLRLLELPEFKSFYSKIEKTTTEKNLSNFTATAESIFDEKVLFPVLTRLKIDKLPVEYIWNMQAIQFPERSNKISFSQLEDVYVHNCDTLVNVFPSNMLPRLQNLGILEVENCPSLTLLVEDLNPNIQSPTIKSKFNDVFPKLIDLRLDNLPKLMKTWLSDEDYCSYDNSVNLHLKRISITDCGSLRQAFSTFVARHLVRIQYLCIKGCPRMEVIVSEARGEGKIDDGTIKFNELEELWLEDLQNLRSFYESKFEAPRLFNYQDVCPNVKTLCLRDLKSTREIQLWDLDSTQEHLHKVRLIGCQVSTKVLSHHLRRSFRIINHLHLENCQGFKHVIDFDSTISVCEELVVDVERLMLIDLPELVFLWNKNLREIEGLRNLKYINIRKCPQMKSLLTHSMATTLQHLKKLVVEYCEMMEEIIIIIEENNGNIAGEEKATWQIEFLKLEYLILIGLPNLKNLCNDERGSFSFSSLRGVGVKNCPKMKTFVSGQICLVPRMMRAVVGDEMVEITNLNAYFETRNHMRKIIHWGDSSFNRNEYTLEDFFDTNKIMNHIYWRDGSESEFERDSESESERDSESESESEE